ncbi:hypothetical protein BD560DRAFT_468721 [Blakeslea trispora]|nr:hypothetical protein BD560DRAFT_468721 [Blakeslea trispora]
MKQISNIKEPLIASITFNRKKTVYDYGTLALNQEVTKPGNILTTSTSSTPIILCTFSIPLSISIPEFLDFVAPVDSSVSHYRVLRDTTPDTYMILMEFRDTSTAINYYKQYNGRLYSSMDPEKCQIMFVESLEINSKPAPLYQLSHHDLEENSLSICPVCLEPMDEKLIGLLTILCQHTFHSRCLSKWEDGSCPVCRYSQKPQQLKTSETNSVDLIRIHQLIPSHVEQSDQNECTICKTSDNLWVCLICGHIGCGRYNGAHAYDHYRQTSHLYSLEISTQRVWDYAGDNYVHRLVQNAVDGKLVELPNHTASSNEQNLNHAVGVTICFRLYLEKVEAMSLEYSYMLTSQLDSQRIYFENQMEALTAQLSQLTSQTRCLLAESDKTKAENKQIEDMNEKKKKQIDEMTLEKQKSEHKLDMWKEKYEAIRKIWAVEKEVDAQINNASFFFTKTNHSIIKNIAERDKAIGDLNDQVRDLMFFLETREKVQGRPELEGASVGTRKTYSRTSRRRGKR